MIIFIIFLILDLFLCPPSYAGQTFNPHTNKIDYCTTIQQTGGSPKNDKCKPVNVDTLTDNGDGTFTIGGGSGASITLDLGDDGGNDSTALSEIAITGDANLIFTEPSADKLLINLGLDWPKADTADDLTCTNCIGPTEITDLTLGTDTAGDYVAGVADGTGIDGTASGEGSTYTPTIDTTEISGNRTWGDASTDTIAWTFNRATGTDPSLTINSADILTNSSLTIQKTDPSVILDTVSATDTDFWMGVTEDAGGDDDDFFQIGDGTTPGTNPFVTIDTGGYVGISATATDPEGLLDLEINNTGASMYQYLTSHNSTGNSIINFRRSGGEKSTNTRVAGTIGSLLYSGRDGASWYDIARITVSMDGTVSSASLPTKFVFETTPAGANADVVRLTIDSAGHLIVGAGENATPNIDTCQIRGPDAGGTNISADTSVIRPGMGTGTGNIGILRIRGALSRLASGSTNHTIVTLAQFGQTQNTHPGTDGVALDFPSQTYQNRNTAGSGTAADANYVSIQQPTFSASNSSVTTTEASTFYIANAPAAGTNMTLTNAYALYVDGGNARFDGNVGIGDGSPDGLLDVGDGTNDTVITATSMTFAGTAKPSKRIFISTTGGMCLTTAGCAAATQSETTTNDVNYFGSAFDGATDENWQTTFTLPENYDAGTFTASVEWTGTHSASSTVVWCVKGMSIADNDTLDTAFGTAACVNNDTVATGDFQRTAETSAITFSGSPAGGDRVWVQVYRDANDAADDNNVDATMLGVWLTFKADALSTED